MTLTTIIILIIIGLVLIAVEIFIIPGTTVVGVLGAACVVTGMVFGFLRLETFTGWVLFGVTLVVCIGLGYFGFKGSTYQRFAVKSSSDGRIIDQVNALEAGMRGTTLTRCAPIGKAQFGKEMEEVYSVGEFIEPHTPIEILYIKENKIFVDVIKS
jgi:membrane-bound ClpP family serine protease